MHTLISHFILEAYLREELTGQFSAASQSCLEKVAVHRELAQAAAGLRRR